MRLMTLLRRLLRVTYLFVSTGYFDNDGTLVIAVRPRWNKPRCGRCQRHAPGYDHRPEPRRWTSLPLGPMRVELEYAVRRVDCRRCGVRVEHVPWSRPDSRFTRDFEEKVAYLAQVTDKTTVTRLMAISWRSVGKIIERVVSERLEPGRLDNLRRIGIDEFSYRRRHNYVTVVVDHDAGRVVWAAEGKSSETLDGFFEELGPRKSRLETITMDMSPAYAKSVRVHAPQAQVVLDRFHVQRLASDAVDKVRRTLWRAARDTGDADVIKGTRFSLLKNPWNLERHERQKLRELQRTNSPLYRAYLLKETLAAVFDRKQLWRAQRDLDQWLSWARRCRLTPFVKLARTIADHKDNILAYVREKLTNGIVEGINNKLRMVARRAYGFHSASALIAMYQLCHGGIVLEPKLP